MHTTRNTDNTDNTIKNSSRTVVAKAVLAAVTIAGGTHLPVVAEAGPVEDVEQTCLADASGSADSLERWVDHCRGVSRQYEATYHDCMRGAPGSADSLERWVDHCATETTGAAGAG